MAGKSQACRSGHLSWWGFFGRLWRPRTATTRETASGSIVQPALLKGNPNSAPHFNQSPDGMPAVLGAEFDTLRDRLKSGGLMIENVQEPFRLRLGSSGSRSLITDNCRSRRSACGGIRLWRDPPCRSRRSACGEIRRRRGGITAYLCVLD